MCALGYAIVICPKFSHKIFRSLIDLDKRKKFWSIDIFFLQQILYLTELTLHIVKKKLSKLSPHIHLYKQHDNCN